MKSLLASLGVLLLPAIVFGRGLSSHRLPSDTEWGDRAMTSGPDRTGRERGSFIPSERPTHIVAADEPEGLPEGLPWEERPAEDESKQAPADGGEEPSAPPEEGP